VFAAIVFVAIVLVVAVIAVAVVVVVNKAGVEHIDLFDSFVVGRRGNVAVVPV